MSSESGDWYVRNKQGYRDLKMGTNCTVLVLADRLTGRNRDGQLTSPYHPVAQLESFPLHTLADFAFTAIVVRFSATDVMARFPDHYYVYNPGLDLERSMAMLIAHANRFCEDGDLLILDADGELEPSSIEEFARQDDSAIITSRRKSNGDARVYGLYIKSIDRLALMQAVQTEDCSFEAFCAQNPLTLPLLSVVRVAVPSPDPGRMANALAGLGFDQQ